MKKSNNLEIINTKFILSKNQQARYRDRLRQLLENEGIISICLEDRSLFIEYKKDILNVVTIKDFLLAINFPMKEQLVKVQNDIAFPRGQMIIKN